MAAKYFLFACIFILAADEVRGQVTQCNTEEYRAVVLNLEALRAQFKDFKEQTNSEITNLKAAIATLNETAKEFDIRLVSGNSSREGRVEVRVDGTWGTVCDDSFDNSDAAVVCRFLGLGETGIAFTDAHFGQGIGVIWMDELDCAGTETSLEDCSFDGWGDHDCEHSEDAGVSCELI